MPKNLCQVANNGYVDGKTFRKALRCYLGVTHKTAKRPLTDWENTAYTKAKSLTKQYGNKPSMENIRRWAAGITVPHYIGRQATYEQICRQTQEAA